MHTKLATAIKNAMKQPKRLYLKKEKRMLEMKEIKRVIVFGPTWDCLDLGPARALRSALRVQSVASRLALLLCHSA